MEKDDHAWRPLRERQAGMAGERALVDGTPDHLLQHLRRWLQGVLAYKTHVDTLPKLELTLRRTDVVVRTGDGGMFVDSRGDDLLEAIDATLHLHARIFEDQGAHLSREEEQRLAWWDGQVEALNEILTMGGSTWRLNDTVSGLGARVDETVAESVRATIRDAKDDASDHLRRAWEAAYGFLPDPTLAYSEAVKAVEAVAIPEVVPNDNVATLGKVLTALKNTPDRWVLTLYDRDGQPASSEALIAMIALLWHGQRDRHAGPGEKATTHPAAQMAVHTAATLVQWFTSGDVQRI